MMYTLYRVCSL